MGYELIFLAVIVAVILYRLRSVLGRRTGHERPERREGSPFAAPERDDENVVSLPGRRKSSFDDEDEDEDTDIGRPVAAPSTRATFSSDAVDPSAADGLNDILGADPEFDAEEFAEGAQGAFEMIVAAFAAGDRDTLRPLLADEVFRNFDDAVAAREAADETLETTIVGIESARITAAEMQGKTAFVTVTFVSDQIKLFRDSDGKVLEGDATAPERIVDIWTFARNTRSRNPNWALVSTEAAEDSEA